MENKQGPIAGIDYPRTFNEFDRFFAVEASCRAYIFRLRWPNGYQCLKCAVPKRHHGLLHEVTCIVGSVKAKYLSQPELYLRVPAIL